MLQIGLSKEKCLFARTKQLNDGNRKKHDGNGDV